MSHIAKYASTLGSINTDLLDLACKAAAKKVRGRTGRTIKDYHGADVSVWEGMQILASVKTDVAHRGVGVTLDGQGRLTFVGDPYGHQAEFDALTKHIEVQYKRLAIARVLAELGYTVRTPESETGTVIVGEEE